MRTSHETEFLDLSNSSLTCSVYNQFAGILQECNELQGQISKLREELSAQEKQQEQEHDKELDAIEFKKLQLQEMERQERWVATKENLT